MAKANHAHTITTMLDAIAPNRVHFNVINNPSPKPAKSATMRAIDKAAAELAANGPVFPKRQKAPQNPYINHYGKILDPEKAAQWQIAQRKGGAL